MQGPPGTQCFGNGKCREVIARMRIQRLVGVNNSTGRVVWGNMMTWHAKVRSLTFIMQTEGEHTKMVNGRECDQV